MRASIVCNSRHSLHTSSFCIHCHEQFPHVSEPHVTSNIGSSRLLFAGRVLGSLFGKAAQSQRRSRSRHLPTPPRRLILMLVDALMLIDSSSWFLQRSFKVRLPKQKSIAGGDKVRSLGKYPTTNRIPGLLLDKPSTISHNARRRATGRGDGGGGPLLGKLFAPSLVTRRPIDLFPIL